MRRSTCNPTLSTRADGADLPPVDATSGPPVVRPVELLKAEALGDAWRIVEVFSRAGLPFDVELHWSSGGGAGVAAWITVARAARIGVHARSLRVVATNHARQPNRVGVTVADGFAWTRNQWEHRARHIEVANPSGIPIPAFAERVRLELAEPHPSAVLRIRDGLGIVRASGLVSAQPPDGVPVGGAAAVELDLKADVDFRSVWQLSI